MWWLWILGVVGLAVIYFLTARPDQRRLREIDVWGASWGPIHRGKPIGAKRLRLLPADMAPILEDVGPGTPLAVFELVPKVAYLGVYGPNASSSAEHQTVFAKLADPMKTMVVRPLPTIDGERVVNTGILFTKDAEFSAIYLVEGDDARAIKAWLSPPVREQLCDMPDLWLRTRGPLMALTRYASPDADRMDELLAAADVIFAEHGIIDASLLGDDLEIVDEPKKKAKKGGAAAPRPPASKDAPRSSKAPKV